MRPGASGGARGFWGVHPVGAFRLRVSQAFVRPERPERAILTPKTVADRRPPETTCESPAPKIDSMVAGEAMAGGQTERGGSDAVYLRIGLSPHGCGARRRSTFSARVPQHIARNSN